MTAKNIKLFTAMQDYGQMIDKITFSVEGDIPQMEPSDFVLTNCFYDLSAKKSISGIKSVSVEGETVTLTMDKFLYRIDDFKITGKGVAEGIEITKTAAESVELLHSDWFDYCVENGVNYRLYTPERAYGPRPLVLFLHGGGGSGENNETQLTDTVGAIKLAERCPDMYIMAPQAPAGKLTMQEMFARMMSKGDPYNVHVGSDPCEEFDSRGWTRWYLGKIADIIRKMIAEGSVDSRRVYVIGMSMGGGGTLKMMSVAPDLFAAAVPICPSMNSESWPILNCLPNIPTYVVSGYIDHSPSRHAYILRAVQNLWKQGRTDVEYLLFTEEELAAYGIGIDRSVTTRELYLENHNSWILVMHNEHCILDWMFSHVKGM